MAKKFAAITISALLASGCASWRAVRFTSSPSKAEVKVGELSCLTPCTLKAPKDIKTASVVFFGKFEKQINLNNYEQTVRRGRIPRTEKEKEIAREVDAGCLFFGAIVYGASRFIIGNTDMIKYDGKFSDSERALLYVGGGGTLLALGAMETGMMFVSPEYGEVANIHVVFGELVTIEQVETDFIKQHPLDEVLSIELVERTSDKAIFRINYKNYETPYTFWIRQDVWEYHLNDSGTWFPKHMKRGL